MKITLGATYRDKVTGFVGMATGKVTGFVGMATGKVKYLTGCSQVLLNPTVDKDGKLRDSSWFDEQRLEIDATVRRVVLDNGATPGPDKPAPKY